MAKQQEAETQFSTIFSSSKTKLAKIEMALNLLRLMQEKPADVAVARTWAQALQSFGEHQLAEAFNWVSLTSKGWPTLGDITECIFEAEFAEDLGWLLRTLRLHGSEWKERPAVYGERWRKPGAHMDDWQPGDLKQPAVPAPEIPTRLFQALAVLGAGITGEGLVILHRHPAVKSSVLAGDEAAKVKFQIERDFKAAWMMARRRDLAR